MNYGKIWQNAAHEFLEVPLIDNERGCTLLHLSFTEQYSSDMQILQKEFEKAFSLWWEETEPHYMSFNNDYTFNLLPSFSLAVADYLDIKRDISMALASIVRIFYFGHHVHELVPDDHEDHGHENELQFFILIGDYTLGKVLHLLTEANLEMLLDIFLDMISKINEGMVLKYHFQPGFIDMLIHSRMPLYASIGLSAATIAQLPEDRKLLFRDLSFCYGMAAELIEQGGFSEEAHRYLFKCEKIFGNINKSPSYINSNLEKAIRDLRQILTGQNEKAATI